MLLSNEFIVNSVALIEKNYPGGFTPTEFIAQMYHYLFT